jgi:hypothetical protein
MLTAWRHRRRPGPSLPHPSVPAGDTKPFAPMPNLVSQQSDLGPDAVELCRPYVSEHCDEHKVGPPLCIAPVYAADLQLRGVGPRGTRRIAHLLHLRTLAPGLCLRGIARPVHWLQHFGGAHSQCEGCGRDDTLTSWEPQSATRIMTGTWGHLGRSWEAPFGVLLLLALLFLLPLCPPLPCLHHVCPPLSTTEHQHAAWPA